MINIDKGGREMRPKRYMFTLTVMLLALMPMYGVAQMAAPAPTMTAGEVNSIFSDAYTDIAGTNFNPNWGQATVVTEVDLGGSNTLLLSGLNYQGINIGSADGGVPHDFSAMKYLHLDVWSENSTALNVFLISTTSGEKSYAVPMQEDVWLSLNIPLTHFSDQGLTLNDIHQFKFDGNGDIYIDNIYFVAGSATLVAAPTPTVDAAGVISVYSDAYTDIAGTNFNPWWGQATVQSEVDLSGNSAQLLTGLNYQGINIGSADGGVPHDVSAAKYLHLDVWSANSTALKVFLISTASGEKFDTVAVEHDVWLGLDIPLTHFSDQGLTLNDIHQFKFDGNGDIYIDNIYFHGEGAVPPLVINAFDDAADIAIGASEFWQFVTDSDDLVNNVLTSTLVSATGIPQDGPGAAQFNYSVESDQGWGGFVALQHTSDAYLDFTGKNYLSFFYRNYISSSIDSSMSLRVTLMDGSEQSDPANWKKDSVEYYYSFVEADYIFDAADDAWSEIRIPLVSTGNGTVVDYSNGFVRTGWAGKEGNNTLDLDKIVGVGFEFVAPNWNMVTGDITYGSIWFDNLAAILTNEIPGCMDPASINYDPDATVDDESCLYPEDVVDVMFMVNMEMETVSENGVHLAGGGTFGNPGDNPMYDDGTHGDVTAGDGVYSLTWQLLNYQSTDYTFINGNNGDWSEKENIAGQDCAVDPYNDRNIVVGVTDTTINTCFGQCTDDGSCAIVDFVSVTFKVNMMDQVTDAAGVFMAGGGLGDAGLVMDDSDGDDIWELTLTDIIPGADFLWKFRNGPSDGNWGGAWEDGDNLGAEGCGAGAYNDRVINTDIDLVLEAVCFSSCYPCTPAHDVDVTFSLSMNDAVGFDPAVHTPYVFGKFNDWDNVVAPVALTEIGDTRVYTATITAESRDTLDYLYGFGINFETMTGKECAVEEPLLDVFVRRVLLPIDTTTHVDIKNGYETCDPFVVATKDDALLPREFAITAFPNPFNPDVTIQYQIPEHENVSIEVVNMLGQHVRSLVETHHSPGHYSVDWNGTTDYGHQVGTGIYFIVVSRASGTSVTKVTMLK